MANKTVYPYGTDGSLPSSIGIINDRTTGGADKAWSAEQGKLLSEDVEKNSMDVFGMNSESVPVSGYTSYTGWYINSTNTWTKVSSSPTNYEYRLVPITPGQRYVVYGSTHVALLNTVSRTSGGTPGYCNGYAGRIVVGEGETYSFTAPEDAVYLYFLTKYNGTARDGSLRTSPGSYDGAISGLQDEIVKINSRKVDTSALNIVNGWYINDSGKWVRNTTTPDNYNILFIPVTAGEKYIVFAGANNAIWALLTSTTRSNGADAYFCEDYPSRQKTFSGHYFEFIAPEDAKYFYLTLKTGGTSLDAWLSVSQSISDQVAAIGGGGGDESKKDGFDTAPEYFAWKKMEQMSKVKWTPLKGTIQKARSTTKFAADTELTGLPYSSVAECDKRVGTDVSLHTFMTAVHNPYSLLYTECVRYGYSQSAYGKQYYGPDNSGPYYGMVCSNYVSYALGLVPYTTADPARLVNEGIMSVVYDQSANGVRRGDILQQSGHVRIVQDVWRKNGVVTHVLINEEVEPIIKNDSIMTAAAFNTLIAENDITIYRYDELYKNIHYTPSPYVAVGDETPETVVYNDDICTFAGDKASFAESDLIYIHCMNLTYPQMELYKDGSLIMTVTLASDSRAAKTSDDLAYAVNLSNDNLGYGKYKARLKNGDDYSDYTYFEIINAVVTVDEEYEIASFSSVNGKAAYWYFTEYQSTNGQSMDKVTPLSGQSSGTINITNRRTGFNMVKVLFSGDYGNVAGGYVFND